MNDGVPGVPPGRMGRLWLRRRLETAGRGAALLERKLYLLHREQARLRALERLAREEWETRCAEADQRVLRAALLGGRRAIRLATAPVPAEVTIYHSTAAGIRYPYAADCVTQGPESFDGASVAAARAACREAAAAAVRYAAAARAVRVIDAEAGATRYRLRAIQDRWTPRLQRALTQVELGLEEQEHADGVRLLQMLGRQQR